MGTVSQQWIDLPCNFKVNVTKLLDPKSRLSLSLCSKSDHEITSKVPYLIDTFCFMKFHILQATCDYGIKTASRIHPRGAMQNVAVPDMIEILTNIVEHPESKIVNLCFSMNRNNYAFLPLLAKHLEENELKIGAEKLVFSGNILADQAPFVLESMECFKPEVLKVLQLNQIPTEEFFAGLKDMEMWKNLEEAVLHAHGLKNLTLESFAHINRLSIMGFETLEENDMVRFVESFKARNPPLGSFFVIVIDAYPSNMYWKCETSDLPGSANKLYVEYLENGFKGKVTNPLVNLTFNQLVSEMGQPRTPRF